MSAIGGRDDATPGALLTAARGLLAGSDDELGGAASRGAALLGRSALEEAIWSLFPELRHVSGRAMLLTLPFVFNRTAARRAALVWSRLSSVAHHHVYELPPTAVETDAMLDIVEEVLAAITVRRAQNLTKAGRAGPTG